MLPVASWFAIDWTDDGTEDYPGGVVLRDDARNVLRVSLGQGDVDCRPYYRAEPEDWIVKAIIAVEDGTYWEHRGIRPFSMLRAACQNVFYNRRISGASTITMQAVRLIKPHPKTMWWKYKEAVMAMKMERAKDKIWILSQYLNRAPYGSNFIGIEAAAAGWFGKCAKDLGIGEAAMLAGMVQAPSRFRPDRGYERALKRRDYVLERMHALGMITADQMEGARSVRPVVCRAPRPFRCPYFCDWVLHEMGRDRTAQRKSGDFVTTLNADVQSIADNMVNSVAERGGYSVAAVVMKVDTGAVVALACSGDYFDKNAGQVNTALAPRPAGSTLKPFLTALAMDNGFVTPGECLVDTPTAFKGYRPSNFGADYRGFVTARDALVLSLNIPFVRLLKRVGVDRFGTNLRQLGFSCMKDPDDRLGLGMAIGNVEITLMELVRAYGVIARGGDSVYSRGASYLISDMLSGSERSSAATGHIADVVMSRFAWKTGTSSAYRDAWTVAWNPEYVIGVWCGHKTGGFGDATLVGAKAAAPVAWSIARSLYPQNNGPWFVKPSDVVLRRVCSRSGLPAGPACKETKEDVALAGRSSAKVCEMHRFDANGNVVETPDEFLAAFSGMVAKAQKLTISKPENDEKFVLVKGMSRQKVVCRVIGNPDESRLWWFVDGKIKGKTVGRSPFAIDMTIGRHEISCSTAEGVTASVSIVVE